MAVLVDILSWGLLLGGCAFMVIGGIGVLRLPDVFTRLHAASLTDTLGVGLIALGLMLQAGFTLVAVKLLLILAFLFFTSPASTHALARTALASGYRPRLAPKPTTEDAP